MKIIDDIREFNPECMADIALALGMTGRVQWSEIIAELFVRIEDEVERSYQLCPTDKHFNPIHVGDSLDTLGEVVGIGDDRVMCKEIYDGTYHGYASFPAGLYEIQNNQLLSIVRAIAADARSGSLDNNEISRYVSAIEVTCNAR